MEKFNLQYSKTNILNPSNHKLALVARTENLIRRMLEFNGKLNGKAKRTYGLKSVNVHHQICLSLRTI